MSSTDLPLYRLVNGKLERVQGDTRDPNKRYAHVAEADGRQYVREFTEDEERQADEDQRRWLEEAPQREAEAKQQEEAHRRLRESLVYQKRIIAFLDVLGWGKAIEKSASDPDYARDLGVAIAGLEQHATMANSMKDMGGFPGDLQVTQFSDSIVISVSTEDSAWQFGLHSLLSSIRFITSQLANANLLVRGGVAFGDLIHKGTMVYGPALVEAYRLESIRAVHPRIVLSDELASEWGHGERIYDRQNKLVEVRNSWVQDFADQQTFLDFLAPWPEGLEPNPPLFTAQLRPYQKIVGNSLQDSKLDVRTREKYLWLARYFNWTLDRFPVTDIPKFEYPLFGFRSAPGKRV
ncbi:hypothetical protein KBI52_21145 [Microvirga sp. HBU67558]|uniref:hypothetical protein n=1 Tax=Microvirga TaxID=186650 RepID=UPI001B375821|nr:MULTISPECIES: hypothetical protein [unclassified Microvirga]MBQ0822696.1 hypothetical protein [Microvirga sp. HBU67558]